MDIYPLALCFLIGLLAGWFSKSWYANRLWWRLKGMIPRRCPSCGRWFGSNSVMHFVEHRIAGWVYLCNRCYHEHYHPFAPESDYK